MMIDAANTLPPAPDEVLHGAAVLVVEDEALIAEELRQRLTRLGARVVDTARSADAAIAAVTTKAPDLVLMDIRLRGNVDGVDAAAAIREGHDVPVVFLTAHTDRATVQRAREAGGYGFLVKPPREGELHAVISMALQQHRARKAQRAVADALAHRNDLLLEKNQSLERFSGAVAHDLSAPLNSVLCSIDMLEMSGPLNEAQRRFADQTRANAKRLSGMVAGLLALSRIGADGIQRIPVSLSSTLADVLTDLHGAIEVTGAAVIVTDLPTVIGDGRLLHVLFMNLVSNALKFARPGTTPTVRVSSVGGLHPDDRMDDSVVVYVEDDGVGFSEDQSRRIFQPFVRLVGANGPDGHGLGLATCAAIVRAHGGSIEASGIPGGGASIAVTLCRRHHGRAA